MQFLYLGQIQRQYLYHTFLFDYVLIQPDDLLRVQKLLNRRPVLPHRLLGQLHISAYLLRSCNSEQEKEK